MRQRMKKLLLFVFIGTMVVGCNRIPSDYSVQDIDVVTLDSCEYLRVLTYGYNYTYSHKGNCKFCAKRRKQEIRALINELKGDKE